ncbi:ATP-binding cassette domain-containing protein [Pseudonocardia sp. NPDC049635]|uniref:ATP-binding cassette domain-containing protein n=1 Tax=Pseudonocardia sp. NPDC049635 TaxID=3155506 RepID=UPI0033F1D704
MPLIVPIQAVLAATLTVGALLAGGQPIDVGLLVGILVLAVRFAEPLTAVAGIAAGFRMAGVGVHRVQAFLAEPALAEPSTPARWGASGDLARVAAAARVDEIVDRLPQGWATPVGAAGRTLSRGGRQRVAIARALLRDRPVVLLDEVASAPDATNERLVGEAVTALARDRAVLVVAHRLQTVLAADRIVVLDEGRIADVGTHTELRERTGAYRRFVESRHAAADWSLVGNVQRTPPSSVGFNGFDPLGCVCVDGSGSAAVA